MQVVRINQQAEREAWLEFKRGKISGTSKVRPLTRGTDRTPQGFWKVLAGKLAVATVNGETPIERGQRCENDALIWLSGELGIELDLNPGVWVFEDDLILSPDGAEPGDKPSYAAEAKNFESENHLKYIYEDVKAKKLPDYNPLFSIPKEYQDQALSYFFNDNLGVLYFVLADDRVIYPELEHYLITVRREDVQYLVDELKDIKKRTLQQVDETIKELLKEFNL